MRETSEKLPISVALVLILLMVRLLWMKEGILFLVGNPMSNLLSYSYIIAAQDSEHSFFYLVFFLILFI